MRSQHVPSIRLLTFVLLKRANLQSKDVVLRTDLPLVNLTASPLVYEEVDKSVGAARVHPELGRWSSGASSSSAFSGDVGAGSRGVGLYPPTQVRGIEGVLIARLEEAETDQDSSDWRKERLRNNISRLNTVSTVS